MEIKTIAEIIDKINEDYRNENGYYMSVYPEMFGLEIAKEIRKLTIEEIANTAEVEIADWECEGNDTTPIYGVDSNSILNLDLNTIQTW